MKALARGLLDLGRALCGLWLFCAAMDGLASPWLHTHAIIAHIEIAFLLCVAAYLAYQYLTGLRLRLK